jgi:biotin transport system substrate-specific component
MQSSVPTRFATIPSRMTPVEAFQQSLAGKILLAVAASAFVATCAHITLPLPFTPVPLVMSDFAVLVVGLLLGPTVGFMSMVLYLAEGAIGLPVFSPAGLGGVLQLLGPTGGYLFSYPLAAAIAGLAPTFGRRIMSSLTAGIFAATLATAVILALGAGWLGHSRFLTPSATFNLAVAPFLYGALAKIVAASLIFSSTRRWLRY